MDDVVKNLLKNLVTLLAHSQFTEIVARNENGRLSRIEIETALKNYPGVMTLPPEQAYESVFVYDVYDVKTEARKIEFDLWFDDEVSDLTLSADIRKNEVGIFVIIIDDIHVL